MEKFKEIWTKLFPPKVGDLIQIPHEFLPIYLDAEILLVDELKEEVLVQYRAFPWSNKWIRATFSYKLEEQKKKKKKKKG